MLAAWSTAVDDEHVARLIVAKEEQSAKAKELHAALDKATAENERLFKDNARLVRLIDSGDWGRARVLELVQAGEAAYCCPLLINHQSSLKSPFATSQYEEVVVYPSHLLEQRLTGSRQELTLAQCQFLPGRSWDQL